MKTCLSMFTQTCAWSVIRFMFAQAIIELNAMRPVDDPFPTEVLYYMDVYNQANMVAWTWTHGGVPPPSPP